MMMTSFPVVLLILLLVSPNVSGVKGPRRSLRRVIEEDGNVDLDFMADRHLEEEPVDTADTRKKNKDKNSKGGATTTTSQVSNANENNPPPLYVSPNGATLISITINKAPGSTPPQQEANGPVLSAQGAPSETPPTTTTTNGGIGNNGASATVVTTANPPAPVPVPVPVVPASPAPTPGPTTPQPTVSPSTPRPTESVSTTTPAPTDNTTIPEFEATGNTTTPMPTDSASSTTATTTTSPAPPSTTTPAPSPDGQGQGQSSSTTPPLPFVDPNIPKPHVPADACANRNNDPQLLESLVASGFKPCTKTGNECNQAGGECCIEVFCMCGKPNGNIVANCVPDYDYYLLLETNK